VPVGARVLAALGPKMLELAAYRSRGAHPYLVTPEHTHSAREVLGDDPLLLPEQTVILTDDAAEARRIGSAWIRNYLALPSYRKNLLRLGFSPDDVETISDKLLDSVIAWGDETAVIGRVNEHLSAGADHVCVQVLTSDFNAYPREQWRRIAAALR
jgi:probable F420-dependent oxidoreductase